MTFQSNKQKTDKSILKSRNLPCAAHLSYRQIIPCTFQTYVLFPQSSSTKQNVVCQPALLFFSVLLCQEKEGGVCSEVIQSEARGECTWVPGAQRESPADRARNAPPPLVPHFTTRRNPDRVEGRHCHSAVRSLKVATVVVQVGMVSWERWYLLSNECV